MTVSFYRAFEDKHRGSRELIKLRLQVYLSFIKPLKEYVYSTANVVDLGCGRGEWLELLQQNDFECIGVDLDEGMLEACEDLGLPVEKGDVIAFLNRLPDESQTIVSGFHIAEHLSFTDLQTLVEESLRILKPAGLLILETPNPENISVGCSGFYTDPTHQKPLPPALLSFLPDYYGFERTKILRLQESEGISADHKLGLLDVLAGISRDYAVVAQKWGDEGALAVVDDAFSKDYGLTLETVALRYQHQMIERLNTSNLKIQALEENAQALEERAQASEERTQALEERAQASEERTQALEISLNELMNSRSWKITTPLRSASRITKGGKNKLRQFLKRLLALIKQKPKQMVIRTTSSVLERPRLKSVLMRFLERSPKLRYRLRLLVYTGNATGLTGSSRELSPRTAQVLSDLKQAMGKK